MLLASSLVLDPLAYDAWLWSGSDPQDYRYAIENPDDSQSEVFPVSKAVNSPTNDSPEPVKRIAL